MTGAVLALAVLGLIVAAAYSVLAHGISPARRHVPQAIPPPPPPPPALPTVEQLAEILDTYRWTTDDSAPIAAELSAHASHDACPWCALCTGDTRAIAALALDAIASPRPRRREAAPLPIVGVAAAVEAAYDAREARR